MYSDTSRPLSSYDPTERCTFSADKFLSSAAFSSDDILKNISQVLSINAVSGTNSVPFPLLSPASTTFPCFSYPLERSAEVTSSSFARQIRRLSFVTPLPKDGELGVRRRTVSFPSLLPSQIGSFTLDMTSPTHVVDDSESFSSYCSSSAPDETHDNKALDSASSTQSSLLNSSLEMPSLTRTNTRTLSSHRTPAPSICIRPPRVDVISDIKQESSLFYDQLSSPVDIEHGGSRSLLYPDIDIKSLRPEFRSSLHADAPVLKVTLKRPNSSPNHQQSVTRPKTPVSRLTANRRSVHTIPAQIKRPLSGKPLPQCNLKETPRPVPRLTDLQRDKPLPPVPPTIKLPTLIKSRWSSREPTGTPLKRVVISPPKRLTAKAKPISPLTNEPAAGKPTCKSASTARRSGKENQIIRRWR